MPVVDARSVMDALSAALNAFIQAIRVGKWHQLVSKRVGQTGGQMKEDGRARPVDKSATAAVATRQ